MFEGARRSQEAIDAAYGEQRRRLPDGTVAPKTPRRVNRSQVVWTVVLAVMWSAIAAFGDHADFRWLALLNAILNWGLVGSYWIAWRRQQREDAEPPSASTPAPART